METLLFKDSETFIKERPTKLSEKQETEIWQKLAKECMRHVKCDTARISKPCDKMYLIIGFNRNTKDDEGVWINQDNQRIDFDYVQESVVASGYTKKELIESTKEYQRLCGITWEQYFQELAQKNC